MEEDAVYDFISDFKSDLLEKFIEKYEREWLKFCKDEYAEYIFEIKTKNKGVR